MSENGYAKQLQLRQEGPAGDRTVILGEIYRCGNDFDQVMCNTDNNPVLWFW